MPILTDSNYEPLSHLIADFADEVDVHKTVIERSFEQRETPCIMCIFYSSAAQKDYLVIVSQQDSFAETLPKLSEVLHLFAARKSHSVLLTVPSKIAVNDVVYDSINFFVAAYQMAYIYYLPYTRTDTNVIWHDDLSYIGELVLAELDQNGVDFVNILHAHVNIDAAPFEASEVLNYLSYHGFAIQSLNEHNVASYIDMSTFEYHSTS
jgi:hypothetical protein